MSIYTGGLPLLHNNLWIKSRYQVNRWSAQYQIKSWVCGISKSPLNSLWSSALIRVLPIWVSYDSIFIPASLLSPYTYEKLTSKPSFQGSFLCHPAFAEQVEHKYIVSLFNPPGHCSPKIYKECYEVPEACWPSLCSLCFFVYPVSAPISRCEQWPGK